MKSFLSISFLFVSTAVISVIFPDLIVFGGLGAILGWILSKVADGQTSLASLQNRMAALESRLPAEGGTQPSAATSEQATGDMAEPPPTTPSDPLEEEPYPEEAVPLKQLTLPLTAEPAPAPNPDDDFNAKYMPIAAFARRVGHPEQYCKELIAEGTYEGIIKDGEWFASRAGLTHPSMRGHHLKTNETKADPGPAPTTTSAWPWPIKDQYLKHARDFFLGGNTVVRVGIVVLLVGVVMLLKYAIDNDHFPIELRFASAAAMGIGLISFGFQQRRNRPGFSFTLQGGGLAALYLVVLFGFQNYTRIPVVPAFALLVAISTLGGLLAVLQDALALIIIAVIGGFMAPVLASTGTENHIAIFSYYLVLNLLILCVAWHKPWRLLNVLGFVFTFAVGTAWGVLSYEPANFTTTEPFLIGFFLIYFAVPILLADRLPGPKRGWVDASLVFGAPPVFLLLQHSLVADRPWGMAFTTLLSAALYVGVGRWLLSRRGETMRSMAEAFLALGVGFATLAIPYALGDHVLTGASWAIEGAGLYWIGVRQKRVISRIAGAALQAVGGFAFYRNITDNGRTIRDFLFNRATTADVSDLHWFDGPLLGGIIVTLSVLYVARHAHHHRDTLAKDEANLLQGLIPWGLFLWCLTISTLIKLHCPDSLVPGVSLSAIGVTGLVLELVGRRLVWLPGRITASTTVVILPILALVWAVAFHPALAHGGWFGWPIYLGAVFLTLRRLPPEGPNTVRWLHPIALWGLTLFAVVAVVGHLEENTHLNNNTWTVSLMGAIATMALAWTARGCVRGSWPFSDAPALYLIQGAWGLAGALILWFLVATVSLSGDASPFPFIPLVNPVDLAQLGFILTFVLWQRASVDDGIEAGNNPRWFPWMTAAFLFTWYNGLLARIVHHWTHIPFDWDRLWNSVPLQMTFSVSWAIIGLCITVWSSRHAHRASWIAGATLLGVVVTKLFVIDLGAHSAPAKIGTFLAVGALLLTVGYLAPIPPAAPVKDDTV